MGGPIDIVQRGLELVIHDHDCDHLVTKVRFKDIPDSDQGDFRCQRAVDSSSFTCARFERYMLVISLVLILLVTELKH